MREVDDNGPECPENLHETKVSRPNRKSCVKITVDRLQQEMVKRFTRLKELNAKFGSLQDTEHLIEVEHQVSTDSTVRQYCEDPGTVCHTGFDGTKLYAEIPLRHATTVSRPLPVDPFKTCHDSESTTPL